MAAFSGRNRGSLVKGASHFWRNPNQTNLRAAHPSEGRGARVQHLQTADARLRVSIASSTRAAASGNIFSSTQ